MSLLYEWPGSDANARPILLMAHQDVVPVAADAEKDWTQPPFSGAVADGFVWGRGTLDDKGSLVGLMEAVEHLVEHAPVLGRHDDQRVELVGPRTETVELGLDVRGQGKFRSRFTGGGLVYLIVPVFFLAWNLRIEPPWVAALPGAMIFITSITFNLLSDGLRSAMDVKT